MSGEEWATNARAGVHVPFPRASDLTVRHYGSGQWCVIEAVGEIDIQGVPLLQHHLSDVPSHLVFDLSRVTFMDASGLGVMSASLRVAIRSGGSVRIVGASSQIGSMLAQTGLDRAMATFPTLEEAVA
ncbi:STAS domain-containing protein [Nocardioides sp.]|uniref:STAS domain-containing protein n=1 Tax=Nocardioides sp. TaxID=35761 RepID=UPI003D09D8D0